MKPTWRILTADVREGLAALPVSSRPIDASLQAQGATRLRAQLHLRDAGLLLASFPTLNGAEADADRLRQFGLGQAGGEPRASEELGEVVVAGTGRSSSAVHGEGLYARSGVNSSRSDGTIPGLTPVAVLFANPRGCYANLPGVDLWDEKRDARLYAGPHPVVAHPPCSRWCRLAGLVEARWGHRRGDDGGCFASALDSVRRWGGVLEHPAYSDAWRAFGLPVPDRRGGWQRDLVGGASCYVEQCRYGHMARKATWLYAAGCDLPDLRWGFTNVGAANWRESSKRRMARVSWCRNHGGDDDRPRVGKKAAAATPPEFRDVLLSIARSAKRIGAVAPLLAAEVQS